MSEIQPPDGPSNEDIEEQRQAHIDWQLDSFPAGSVKRADGETYEEYIARVVGDKGEETWNGWNDSQRIEFLCENFAHTQLALANLANNVELLIQANNTVVKDLHDLKNNKNRFGVPSKRH